MSIYGNPVMMGGSGGGGGGGTFDGTLIGTYTNSTQGGLWYNTGHDTTDDTEYVIAYCYQDTIKKVVTVSKSDILSPPNGDFLNIGAELTIRGDYTPSSGFNMRITSNTLYVSFGASGTNYSAKVYSSTNTMSFFAPLFEVTP